MANVKISALPAVTTVVPGSDVLPLVSGGITTKATPNQIVQAVLPAPGAIGGTTPNAGAFTTLSASSTVSGTGFSTYLASPPAIGGTVAAAGSFTTLSASSTVSGTGFSTYLASPPAIGGTAAAAGSFTTLSASSTVSGTGFSNYLASPPAIGGTAAAAGTFTTLSSTSNTTLGSVSGNTVTLNAATVTLNNSTTISAASTKTLTLNGGAGSNGLVLDASNNVGIGTSSPGAKLDVSGFIKTTSGAVFQGASNSATGAGLEIGYNGSNQGFIQSFNRSASTYQPTRIIGSQILFDLSNTVSMTLDSSGNLGLGVTPSAWGSGQVALQIGADASFMATKTGADLNISSNAYYDGTNWRYIRSSVAASNYYQTLGTHVWRYAASGTAGNAISFTQAMTLDASGYLLVGYTSSNGAYKLQVNSQIFATSATIATSDANYKTNIKPISSGLSLVNALNPVQFNWKAHEVHAFDVEQPTVGFLAQEVKAILKDTEYAGSIVYKNECELLDGSKEEFLGLADGKLIPLLVAAIKELSAELNELKQKVNA